MHVKYRMVENVFEEFFFLKKILAFPGGVVLDKGQRLYYCNEGSTLLMP